MLRNEPQKVSKSTKNNTENFKESIREIAKKDGKHSKSGIKQVPNRGRLYQKVMKPKKQDPKRYQNVKKYKK